MATVSPNDLLCYYTFDSNPYTKSTTNGTDDILNIATNLYDLVRIGTTRPQVITTTQCKYGIASLFNSGASGGTNYCKCAYVNRSLVISKGLTFACWAYFTAGSNNSNNRSFFMIGDSTSNIGVGMKGLAPMIQVFNPLRTEF
jgi:hypothetical protein